MASTTEEGNVYETKRSRARGAEGHDLATLDL